MKNICGVWVRPGVEMRINEEKIVTKCMDPDAEWWRRTIRHDYILEDHNIELYSPTVHDIKHSFKGELRIIMITHDRMTLQSEGGITNWERR